MFNSETLEKKWAPILEAADAPAFADASRKSICAVLLENQEQALRESRSQASFLAEDTTAGEIADGGSVDNWDPVLISLVRRAMPNLIAYDVAGVQPMNGPTGLIFAMKSRYQTALATPGNGGTDEIDVALDEEALFQEPKQFAKKVSLTDGQGGQVNGNLRDMGFTIEKTSVTAETRALQAEYTMELAQDLKKMHGLDAEAELANILSTEILAEINREVIDAINSTAKAGGSAAAPGEFDLNTHADGRWAVEKFKSLMFQLEQEANEVARETRRGKGNFVICSSNVASALAASGTLDYAPAISAKLNVDDTGNTFAGTLNGRIKVYIDPYSTADYATTGYKGSNSYDAGLYYCPYVPLTMMRAVDPGTFQPKIGFKTRYGMRLNPFSGGGSGDIVTEAGANQYFRTMTVSAINVDTPTV